MSNQVSVEKKTMVEYQNRKSLDKLPACEILNFYSDPESWLSFKELFQSSFLDNNNLSNIQKLQYLQMCAKAVLLS